MSETISIPRKLKLKLFKLKRIAPPSKRKRGSNIAAFSDVISFLIKEHEKKTEEKNDSN